MRLGECVPKISEAAKKEHNLDRDGGCRERRNDAVNRLSRCNDSIDRQNQNLRVKEQILRGMKFFLPKPRRHAWIGT